MKKIIISLALFIFLFDITVQAKDCFLVKEQTKVIKNEGNCQSSYTPQSTFKIALSLMGFDSGILESATAPTLPFKAEYSPGINVCKGDHNAKTWMRDSCVWFSQVLTSKLGMERFRDYVRKFNYGNKDVSGDAGKNNGLRQSWLNSSLRITPEEQIQFIQSMIDKKLPVSAKAFEMTKEILFIQELPGGWNLYGKTGNGRYKGELQQGWFVGWIEKGERKLTLVNHIADESKQSTYASFRSKNDALTKLWYLIDELEK
jgi:beta-lactamase class D